MILYAVRIISNCLLTSIYMIFIVTLIYEISKNVMPKDEGLGIVLISLLISFPFGLQSAENNFLEDKIKAFEKENK